MSKSKIEWTEKTWNPITGCTKCSPGCLNCYAERMTKRHQHNPKMPKYQAGFDKVVCHEPELSRPYSWRKPRMVFVNSMSDTFHPDVDRFFQHNLFDTMTKCPQHTFQVLTKRPKDMLHFADNRWAFIRKEWPDNVWSGLTVCNQAEADEKIPYLLQVPAKVRFLSVEPMRGPVDISPYFPEYDYRPTHKFYQAFEKMQGIKSDGKPILIKHGIDWVIVGGESGPGARPMHPDWVRSIRDQCVDAGVPFFFKQVGEWAWASSVAGGPITHAVCKHGKAAKFSKEEMIFACPECTQWEGLRKIGKKKAGRLLDGRVLDQMPDQEPPKEK